MRPEYSADEGQERVCNGLSAADRQKRQAHRSFFGLTLGSELNQIRFVANRKGGNSLGSTVLHCDLRTSRLSYHLRSIPGRSSMLPHGVGKELLCLSAGLPGSTIAFGFHDGRDLIFVALP